ncbi:beta-1,4-glucuronosyltransferase WelK [Sphingomonas elodea]|uniref:Beta-1,4-glucuronosyltransferase n=2 Tax=Sphingomonas TaxID=13687 RepID=Q9APE1_SPHPI|nr:PssD/Cps14F family polysaccharide biosynthesis glycosyltransferase [Sphingomonas elodea]AAG59805.1 beta-1,4-glucuronosyltransferase [Sphingomonas elodea ATCC 31461]AAP57686.1 beta-1,4-glucuronosyltransferase [Sphingomonas elodea ATCC 31461]
MAEATEAAHTTGKRLKMCLAASGGGHLRQILDLESVWREHDYFFVTEDTALGRSLAEKHPVELVGHYALGQARLGHPFKMLGGALRNLRQSLAIVRRHKPDVVISTGAGAVYFTALFAKLFGAKFIHIESFARFDHPSAFGKMVKGIATISIVQSPALKQIWPDAELFDPFRMLDTPRPPKQALTFATVGATLPFPRLVQAVLDLKRAGGLPGKLILQYGDQALTDPGIPDVEIRPTIPFDELQLMLRDADIVICHGGTGSLVTALRAGCRVIAFPRRFDLGEHYDDHQEEIAQTFADRGLLQAVRDERELGAAVAAAKATEPRLATTDHTALAARLRTLLAEWGAKR